MSKFIVKTNLTNVTSNKDGTFSYKEDIVSMKWTSAVDAVVYNPLTGNYTYKEQAESPIYNEFWTAMGQPRKITDKDKSPRKEKKKKKKPKADWYY